MKKSILARGFIGSVASLLGVMAVGCSSEPLSPEEAAEIGVTEQAVVASDIVASNAFDRGTVDAALFAAHCTVTEGGNSYMLVAGGIESFNGSGVPTYSDKAVLLRPGTGWTTPVTFTGARAFASAVQVPGSPDKCLMGGGENGSGKVDQLVMFTLTHSGGVPVITASDAGKLTAARAKLQAVPCGSDQVLFMGGGTGVAGTYTPSNVMDVWDGESSTTAIQTLKNTNASPATVTLNTARHSFAADVKSSDNLRIALAGGVASGGNSDNIEALQVTSACALDSASLTKPLDITGLTATSLGFANRVRLNEARSELVSVHKSSPAADREVFIFAIGNTGAATKREDVIRIDYDTPGPDSAIVSTSNAQANLQAVANPAFVKIAADRFVIVGGTGTGDDYVQEYNAGTWTSTNQDSTSAALVTRVGASIALVGSDVFYTAGKDPATSGSSTTFRTTTFNVF